MAKFSILNAPCEGFGKYEGERIALALAHRNSLDKTCDSFGDIDSCGFHCASFVSVPDGTTQDVYFVETSQGFTYEISAEEYAARDSDCDAAHCQDEEPDHGEAKLEFTEES